MRTFFASPERSSADELREEIEFVSSHPLINGLMSVMSGFVAVLNEHRQVLALNDSLLTLLGIDSPGSALGLRPGEALQCVHACDPPAGCGTTEFCSTCGAAVAMVASLTSDQPQERTCAMTVVRRGRKVDLLLRVRSCPIVVGKRRLLLLFLQDIGRQQQWAALERVFFHDITNIVSALAASSELLFLDEASTRQTTIAQEIRRLCVRLAQEVRIQRCLVEADACGYRPSLEQLSAIQVLRELQTTFANHPAAQNKVLRFPAMMLDVTIKSEISLLLRVLGNMLVNAFEATEEGGEVRIWIEPSGEGATFCVWNHGEIPGDIAKRVFQRNFSTKLEAGRGLGTFSMKLLGEQFLGGKVEFTTSEKTGTVFRFQVPP